MPSKDAFAPTRWSLIATLQSGETVRVQEALETLCHAYWYPLYAYIRRAGHSPEDAADLTQSFFAQLLEKDMLARADPARGRLRTFLLTALQHFLCDDWRKQQRLKRGGGVVLLSIDEPLAESLYASEPADPMTPEAFYHRCWALTLLDRTLAGLEADYARDGKAAIFEALKPALADESGAPPSAEIGAALGMEPGAVRMAVLRLRRRYRERLLAEVATSMDAKSDAEVDEEIDALFRALS
ncbi:MAG TPA: sigma factor [Verrucomicrobiales bacterium]|nr:sigma factor [Verrucomicrobiales bacterium]